jgi:hypothetical protein
MSRDFVYDVLVFNASYYPDCTSATATDLDVYVEDAYKTLSVDLHPILTQLLH